MSANIGCNLMCCPICCTKTLLSGHEVQLKRSKVTQPDFVMKVRQLRHQFFFGNRSFLTDFSDLHHPTGAVRHTLRICPCLLNADWCLQPNLVTNSPLQVANEGMPQHNFPSQKGSLYVKYTVMIPTKLSSDQKTQIGQVLSSSGKDEL